MKKQGGGCISHSLRKKTRGRPSILIYLLRYFLTSLLPYFILQKRQRPFRSDGGICEKGAPSSGEKIVTAQRLSFPAVEAEEAHSSEISLGGLARSCSPRAPRTAPPPVPSAECSLMCRSYFQNGDPNACS